MRNFGIILTLIFTTIFNLSGQIDVYTNSPDAASLGSYGSVPVGLFTGTAQMNIPLFELKTKNLTLPISLNYSSNGLVVDKVASRVGFDWSLFAGGAIVRQIVGLPDDIKGLLTYPGNLSGSDLADFLKNYYSLNDFEPDMYSYNFNGYSGTFIFDAENNVSQIPAENLKISRNGFTSFEIITPDGIKYEFQDREFLTCVYGGCEVYTVTPSTWYLTKITHPLGDVISFNYSNPYPVHYFSGVSETIADVSISGESGSGNCQCEVQRVNPVINTLDAIRLNSITTTDHWQMIFEYSQNRLDFVNEYKLDKITQYNSKNEKIKTVKLDYIFDENNPSFNAESTLFPHILLGPHENEIKYRMFLSSAMVFDAPESESQDYHFEYYDLGGLPSRLSYAQDHWGFFNGKYSNNCLIPTSETYIPSQDTLLWSRILAENLSGNREPDALYSQKGLLKKIIYPTKGYTEIEYESQYFSEKEHGGNRVKKTIDHPLSGNPTFKEYQYLNGKNYSLFKYFHTYNLFEAGPLGTPVTCNYTTALSNSMYPLFSRMGYHIAYPEVFVSNGSNNKNGAERHYFKAQADAPGTPTLGQPIIPMRFYNTGWMTGRKLHEYYYSKDKNGDLILLSETEYIYDELENRDSISLNYLALNREAGRYDTYQITTENEIVLGECDVVPYAIHSRWHPLKSKITRFYDQNSQNPLIIVEDNEYGNHLHKLVTETNTINSDGGTSKTKIKYPSDYNRSVGGTNELLTLGYMVDRHMINYPIEIVNYVDEMVVGGKLNIYRMQPTEINLYKELTLNTQWPLAEDTTNSDTTFTFSEVIGDDPPQFFMDNHYELEKEYSLYDHSSNLLQYKGSDEIENAIIWGYNNLLPIASVQNSSYSQIAHTSFEDESSKGGWSYIYDLTTINQNEKKTGLHSFQGLNITKSSITSGDYYISFWAKQLGTGSGIININGEDHYISTLDWEFYQLKLSSATSVSINLTGILLDELRLHPADAQMTTYTHKPLIGLTSRTDFNGLSTYYEYDSFGRLSRIRDNHQKILKEYEYNYQPY